MCLVRLLDSLGSGDFLGSSGGAGPLPHGIARAMLKIDENLKKPLRQNGLLTRDPRVKERKKYGLKRARKAPQYTKR